MDHKDVGATTTSGNRFLLNFVDYTTRFTRSYPVPTKEAKHVVRAIKDLISWTRPIVTILSDNALEFKAVLLKKLYSGFKIEPRKTAPYRPSTNGLCEKYNDTMYKILLKMTKGGSIDWDENVGHYSFLYNLTYQMFA